MFLKGLIIKDFLKDQLQSNQSAGTDLMAIALVDNL